MSYVKKVFRGGAQAAAEAIRIPIPPLPQLPARNPCNRIGIA
jgi:hypothetical protein